MRCLVRVGMVLAIAVSSYSAGAAELNGKKRLLDLLSKHPRWLQQEQKVLAVQANKDGAEQPLYNPELSLGYESKSDPGYQLGVTQVVDIHDKRDIRYKIADVELFMERLAERDANNKFIAESLQALNDLHQKEKLLLLAEGNKNIINGLVEQAEKKYEAGDISLSELKLVRLSLSSSTLSAIEAATSLEQANAKVFDLVGEKVWVKLPKISHKDLDKEINLQEALANTLPVKLAQAESRISELKVKQSALNRRADPTVGFGIGNDGSENFASLTLSIPLNVRNTYSAELKAAEYRNSVSAERLRGAIRAAEYRLQSVWNQLLILGNGRRDTGADDTRKLAQYSELLERMWLLGEMTTNEYLQNLQQRNAAIAAEIELESSFTATYIDWLELNDQLFSWISS